MFLEVKAHNVPLNWLQVKKFFVDRIIIISTFSNYIICLI